MFRLSRRYNIHPVLLAIFFVILLIATSVSFGYLVENLRLFQSFDRVVYNFFQFTWHPHWLDVIITPFNFNNFLQTYYMSNRVAQREQVGEVAV